MYIPSLALPIYKTTCHAKPYLYRSVQYRYLRNVTCTNMRKNMYVVTPRYAAAAAVASAVALRRPTTEYTHPYPMMHRRLPTAGIEVAPHYHQLLVLECLRKYMFLKT